MKPRRTGVRDDGLSIESSPSDPGPRFLLPDADAVAAAWSNRSPEAVLPPRPDKATTMSLALLLLGVALLLFVPLGGALLLVTGGLGLAIASEAPMGRLTLAPAINTDATTTAIHPHPSSSTDH
jgi:hypothetical protein